MDTVMLDSIDTSRLKRNLGKVFKDIHESQHPIMITRNKQPSALLFPIHFNTKVEALALRGCPGGALITPKWFRDHISDVIKEVQFGFANQVRHVRAAVPPKSWPKSQTAVIIKFHIQNKSAFVLLPVYRGKEIFGQEVIGSRARYESLPFTDMRKNRH